MLFIALIWTYTIPWSLMPLMHVWGRFVPEGFLTSCTFDYLTDSPETRYFVATIFTFSYCIPMTLIIYYYSQIVSHVIEHEKSLREQAKKMNVESLRSNANTNAQSAEIRIAKVIKIRTPGISLPNLANERGSIMTFFFCRPRLRSASSSFCHGLRTLFSR